MMDDAVEDKGMWGQEHTKRKAVKGEEEDEERKTRRARRARKAKIRGSSEWTGEE